MKIKYSNLVKNNYPKNLLYQCIQLALSIKPKESYVNIYHFDNNNEYLKITQLIPLISYEREIFINKYYASDSLDDLISYCVDDCLYLMTWMDIQN